MQKLQLYFPINYLKVSLCQAHLFFCFQMTHLHGKLGNPGYQGVDKMELDQRFLTSRPISRRSPLSQKKSEMNGDWLDWAFASEAERLPFFHFAVCKLGMFWHEAWVLIFYFKFCMFERWNIEWHWKAYTYYRDSMWFHVQHKYWMGFFNVNVLFMQIQTSLKIDVLMKNLYSTFSLNRTFEALLSEDTSSGLSG